MPSPRRDQAAGRGREPKAYPHFCRADQLSLAIGRRGQNARLTSILTGWQIDIDPEEEVKVGFEEQVAEAVDALAAIPGIEKAQADAIVHAGLLTLDALNGVEADDLKEIPGLEDSAETVLAAAKAEIERRAGGSQAEEPAAKETPEEEPATEAGDAPAEAEENE